MTNFTWVAGQPPLDMRVSQVYGFLFVDDGRILLRAENEKFSLPGGRPEVFDEDYSAVLRREAVEEVNVKIGAAVLIGYQQVDEGDGLPSYAQIRMVAKISEFGPRQPDPDTGRIYGRVLADWVTCAKLLSWGDAGDQQVRLAYETAVRDFGPFTESPDVLTEV